MATMTQKSSLVQKFLSVSQVLTVDTIIDSFVAGLEAYGWEVPPDPGAGAVAGTP